MRKPISSSQYKFIVLGVLGGIIVILIWIASLPFNLRINSTTGPAGPSSVLHVITNHISIGSRELFNSQRLHSTTQESN